MQENNKDKLLHWRLIENLTIDEAAALWIGEEPPFKWIEEHYGPHPLEDNPSFSVVRSAIESAIMRGELRTARFVHDGSDYGDGKEWPHSKYTTVKREALAEWALGREERPAFLAKEIERLEKLGRGLEQVLPFLNDKHPKYADELAIACQAWMALYEEGDEKRRRKSHKKYIKDWLIENYPKLSNSAAERISKVVNPHKKGGAPTQ